MEINKAFPLIPMLVFLSFFDPCLVCCVNSFTIDLIHRDSPLSPFHNSSSTSFERVQNAYRRSYSRASLFNKDVNSITSTVSPIEGEYLMKISIGTPPVETLVTLDTGSDLTWIQCEPCVNCFQQSQSVFNPKNSSTYFTVDCDNLYCRDIGAPLTCKDNICDYKVTYSDKSHTAGDLSIETFAFATTSGGNVPIPDTFFGCGHDNGDLFPFGTSGVVGLGGGPISIVNQMNDQIEGRFSYCLVPFVASSTNVNLTSRINFGDSVIMSDPGTVLTALGQREAQKSFYFLTLESISVGDKNLPFKISSDDVHQGNIIIDSGTTLTLLRSNFYAKLEETLVASIKAPRIDDPTDGSFKVCYASDIGNIGAPKIVAHFTYADVELSPMNTFIQLGKGVVCFAMLPVEDDGIPIFGNLAQTNFLIGYNLVSELVSFLPTDCTKH